MKDLTFEGVVDKATDYYERNIKQDDKDVKKVFNTHASGGGGGDRKPKPGARNLDTWQRIVL